MEPTQTDTAKDWLKAIIDFDGTTPDARDHASLLLDVLCNPLGPFEQMVAERIRQVDAKGYDAAHDDQHDAGEIAAAAAGLILYDTPCEPVYGVFPGRNYRAGGADGLGVRTHPVPFRDTWMQDLVQSCRHKTTERRLVIAGAMIAAEINRLRRKAGQREGGR